MSRTWLSDAQEVVTLRRLIYSEDTARHVRMTFWWYVLLSHWRSLPARDQSLLQDKLPLPSGGIHRDLQALHLCIAAAREYLHSVECACRNLLRMCSRLLQRANDRNETLPP